MRRGLLTFFSMAVFVWNAFAQDQIDRAKYELIRETINFLATDKVVSQDTGFSISCEPLDYDCFTSRLSGNPISGIARWYNSWRSVRVTDTVELKALRDQLLADILDRPGKGYRKQLPGYAAYRSRMDYLVSEYTDGMPVEEMALDTASAIPESYVGLSPADSDPLIDHTTSDNPEDENPMIGYLALGIGILALLLAVMPVFKKKDHRPAADLQGLADRLDELSLRMKRLERQLTADSKANEAVTNLTDIMESIEKRVVDLESRSKFD